MEVVRIFLVVLKSILLNRVNSRLQMLIYISIDTAKIQN